MYHFKNYKFQNKEGINNLIFQILQKAGITSTYAYSGLDPSARKIALGRFTNKKCSVLIVTDVAARGLDLPALDTVINYNFPAKPKLFVHRVGKFVLNIITTVLLPKY